MLQQFIAYLMAVAVVHLLKLIQIQIQQRKLALLALRPGHGRAEAARGPGHVLGKNPGDVWPIAAANFRGAHFATLDASRKQAQGRKEELVAEAESLADSSEWNATADRLKQLMANERRKHERVAAETPIHELIFGYPATNPEAVPVSKLSRHVSKLGRKIKPAEMTDVLARLKALDANRSNVPLPKGPIPTNLKGARQNMRGR